jgi:Zn finger protein HypA/HybF involved in hydrogenase expression
MALKVNLVSISEVKPYHRNPRKNDNAVDKVAESITKYGFNQPITVDKNNEIITGHTRYKAAIKLGLKKVPVCVLDLSREKVTEYRIADNKAAEFATWDKDLLIPELREVGEIGDFQVFFNEDLNSLLDVRTEGTITRQEIKPEKIEAQQEAINTRYEAVNEKHKEDKLKLICPNCGEDYELSRSSILGALDHGQA